ncbi:protein NLRC5-like [Alosa sapidissima]|uniref:protein NLRC5-like n=1 Tax=Alosa sapidissima TaxID=34773 RepID=UPI001C0880CC|nr:protein NLRC5-like [Alosa sapidissima]
MSEEAEGAAGHRRPESALHSCVTMETDQDTVSMNKASTRTSAGPQTHRPPSPVPSSVSMKSDKSMHEPPVFSSEHVPSGLKAHTHRPPSPVPSCVSMKSDKSMDEMPTFSSGQVPSGLKAHTHRPPSPVPSCVSMKSDKSMKDMPKFSSGQVPSGLKPQKHRPPSPVPSGVSMKSNESMSIPPQFSCGLVPSGLKPQTHRPPSPAPSGVSLKSNVSMPNPPHFSSGPVPSGLKPQKHRPPSRVPSGVSLKSNVSLPIPPQFSSGPVPSGLNPQKHRPPSPAPSCVSLKSNVSLPTPPQFSSGPVPSGLKPQKHRPPSRVPSGVSLKSNVSLPIPPQFSSGPVPSGLNPQKHRPPSPAPSCVSLKSNVSLPTPPQFSSGPVPSGLNPQKHRPPSPAPSCVSLKSNVSLPTPPQFSSGPVPSGLKPQKHRPPSRVPSGVSLKSNVSLPIPPQFSSGPVPSGLKPQTPRPPSPVSSCVSMKSDVSMLDMPTFSSEPVPSGLIPQRHRPPSPVPSCVSMKSDQSMLDMPTFSSEPVPSGLILSADLTQDQSRCGVCEQVLRDPVITTCGHSFCRQCISSDWEQPGLPGDQVCPQCGKTCSTQPPLQPPLDEHTDMSTQGEHTGLINSRRHLHAEHTPGRKRELDEDLRRVIKNHKVSLKRRFENISEGIIKPGAEILLNKIYTELYITEGESEGVNKEHEVWQVESASRSQSTEDTPINCNDIFKPLPGQEKHIRTVMTKGVAGIGKTVSVQKFILDWTDGVANQDIDFMLPLSFRELNLVRGDQYSLHRLLLDFHPELKELNDGEGYKDCQVVFIFDGLDESRLTLNLEQNSKLSDVKQTSSVDVLMTSLIQGTLLPSALIWITSRPAAASQIPAQYINQVTEVRGFNDPQKEEYFRKRIGDDSQANRIISHIKASRSLHIMCHIPVFCWIAATVLEQIMKKKNIKDIPKTLTEMFIQFLLIQTTRKDQKYQSETKANQAKVLESQREILLKLAELAFRSLDNGNLMFYEEDLQECGIDVSEASVYSGMCTEIFKTESVFHQKKVYCFVHLSVQEFLAALYVFHSYVTENLAALTSLISDEHRQRDDPNPSILSSLQAVLGLQSQDHLHVLLKSAVDEALKSSNGHLDLFLRFLMGISLESNQRLLKGLLNQTYSTSKSIKETCQYMKELNRKDLSPERCINLFHCLFEMNDHSMHKEIQKFLSSPKNIKQKLSPAHCSALAHMLLMSEYVLDEIDLKKYNTSDEGRRRLIPAVRCCRKARLFECRLSEKSCGIVGTVLQSPNSLTELDLNHNDLGDSGVQLLSKGLSSPHCKLQTLRLAECRLSENACGIVAAVLQSPNSLTELDLSHNDLGDSGVQLLSKGLSSPNCKLQTLRLSKCGVSDEGYVCLSLALMINPSCVKELYVNNNHSGGSAQKLLSATLEDPHRKVETLQLAECKLSEKSCGILAVVLQSPNSLTELDLNHNDLGDSGVQLLSKGLSSPSCKLQTLRLAECKLSEKSCGILAVVLQSPNSLTELDLNHNDLGDSGVQLLSKGLSSPSCKLQTLRLSKCGVSDEGYVCLALAMMINPSCVKELYVNNNHSGGSAQKLLSATLEDPHRKVETLQLAECKLSEKSCGIVAAVLQSPNSLMELDLSHNDLGDSGVQLLSKGLSSPHCKLQTLRLSKCGVSDEGYVCLSLALMINPSCVKELYVNNNHSGGSAQKLLSATLEDPHRKVETLQFADCKLTDKSCEIVASVLQSANSLLQLDLSDNDLGDSGVQLLSKGLSSFNCKIHTLRLSDCLISEKGCGFLASALSSNPSHLKLLDLSYNYPGESGLKLLSARLEDPVCKLEILKTDHASLDRARPRLLRYVCDLTLDPNTAHRNLSLSEGNRKVTRVEEQQPYPEHPERFDSTLPQVLCREGLTGRCYWEAEWSVDGGADISVAYKSTKRKGDSDDVIMGRNAKSWSLYCSGLSYSVRHNDEHTDIPAPSSRSRTVGVYLDWPAGTLSFYSVSTDTLTHLHTFHSTFTEPLYPGFGVYYYGSSVSLRKIT